MKQILHQRTIMHLDMDAFYAAVEVLDNPDLAGQCLVVGGHSQRGVVAAASYEARKHGIHSAMPMFQARQCCKDIVVVRPRRKRYAELSRQIMAIIASVSPRVEQVSIDEAYADISGCERLHGPPRKMARQLKDRIKKAIGLTASIGIAPNRFLAKIASDSGKPDGLVIIKPEAMFSFIADLPIEKVPGVGKQAKKILTRMGIATLGDIGKYPEDTLVKRLGKFGYRLLQLSQGVDETPISLDAPTKSISSEETLNSDTSDKEILKTKLMHQAESVGRQLRRHDLRARTITIKIKHNDFKQVSRSRTLDHNTQSTEIIYRQAVELLDRYQLNKPVRLIGVGVSSLGSGPIPVQLGLFDDVQNTGRIWEDVDHTIDRITAKFGKGSIQKARLTKSDD